MQRILQVCTAPMNNVYRYCLLVVSLCLAGTATALETAVEHGRYVFFAAGCISCHTAEQALAGGRPLETPFGTFHPPNISPSPDHGIGTWKDSDLERALRQGISPDGQHYYPAFPYPSYTRMAREDIQALYAYLMAQPAYARENRPHELHWPYSSAAGIILTGSLEPTKESTPHCPSPYRT